MVEIIGNILYLFYSVVDGIFEIQIYLNCYWGYSVQRILCGMLYKLMYLLINNYQDIIREYKQVKENKIERIKESGIKLLDYQ